MNQRTNVEVSVEEGRLRGIFRRGSSGAGERLAEALVTPARIFEIARPALFGGLDALMERALTGAAGHSIFEKLLDELNIQLSVRQEERARIPASGPLVVVANHPFGILEGAVLAALCLRARPDVKIMANHLLPQHELLRDHFIRVDPYGRRFSRRFNCGPLREAVRWLRAGGALIVFPAGDVSWPDWKRRTVADPEWSPVAARLIRLSQATALPVFVRGANSFFFHVLGMLHPRLRSLRLPAEFLNKRGRRVELRIGRPVSFQRLAALNDREATEQLRTRTYLLAYHPAATANALPNAPAPLSSCPESNVAALAEALPADRTLKQAGEWRVLCFNGMEAPELMREIGRLREAAFRAVGEGTGQPVDLDRFDLYYDQLVLWNVQAREIAGGYRLARVEPVLKRVGIHGLYTASLFEFHPTFFRSIGPAIELSRSFVTRAYQKQYAPLLRLWEGIGAYICRHPECRYLFGAVSVSAHYQPLSRHVLAAALSNGLSHPEFSRWVTARRRLEGGRFPHVGNEWRRLLIRDPQELSDLLADLEPDGKGLPVLMRQYLRLGGRVLSFSVDESFGGVLDGLVIVDLLETERSLLERYMGTAGAASFLKHHRRN